jgi:protein prenyltransferase alpha subunit repeat containing protein 1
MSIEILPTDWESSLTNPHQPFEFIENHLGIPKGVYYKTYLQAIRRFEDVLNRGVDGLDKEGAAELTEISCVILLVNPAHSTCLNRRRDLVEQGVLSEEEELGLIASVQLLPESAKSSTLWSYRRWLLRRIYSSKEKERSLSDDLDDVTMPLEAISRELAIATTASEIYPRNYHAWLHRYKCLHSLASYEQHPKPSSSSFTLLSQVLRAEEFAIRKWVDMNVGDYSAMQYLCYVYSILAKMGIRHIQMHTDNDAKGEEGGKLDKISFSPLEHAVDLVQRYPTHEALWYYLRAGYALRGGPAGTKIPEQLQDTYGKNFERWRAGFDAMIT